MDISCYMYVLQASVTFISSSVAALTCSLSTHRSYTWNTHVSGTSLQVEAWHMCSSPASLSLMRMVLPEPALPTSITGRRCSMRRSTKYRKRTVSEECTNTAWEVVCKDKLHVCCIIIARWDTPHHSERNESMKFLKKNQILIMELLFWYHKKAN